MFPNNPLFVEKLVQTKQAEITRETQGIHAHPFRDIHESPIRPKVKYKMWVLVSVLIVLAWIFTVII
jgi:hypothetical protein